MAREMDRVSNSVGQNRRSEYNVIIVESESKTHNHKQNQNQKVINIGCITKVQVKGSDMAKAHNQSLNQRFISKVQNIRSHIKGSEYQRS